MGKHLFRNFIRNNKKFNLSVGCLILTIILTGTVFITSGCEKEERTGYDFNSASVALKRIVSPDEKTYYKDLNIPRMIEYEAEDGKFYYYIEYAGTFEKSKMTGNPEDDFEFSAKIICIIENEWLKDSLRYKNSTGTFGESNQADLFAAYTEVVANYTYMHELTSEEINDVLTKTKESVNAAYHSGDTSETAAETQN